MNIIIFSRPVRSGKTTDLMQWCEQIAGTKIIGGILMPDVDGCRKIFDIRTKEYLDIECKDPAATTRSLITVGAFNFYPDAFITANSILLQAASKSDLLIVDEVGKLELESKGFYQSIKLILENNEYQHNLKSLLLVVRDSLYQQVLSHFEITEHRLANSLNDI